MSDDVTPTQIAATVPLPSADLMHYFMQETKEEFKKINEKLDDLGGNFTTKEEVAMLQKNADDEHAKIWSEIKSIKSNAKWWVGTILAIASLVVALVWK